MTLSPETRAVARTALNAVAELTTQVRRIADAQQTPVAAPDDALRDRVAAALTDEHHRRAREQIVASPEEHSAAMADVALRALSTPVADTPSPPWDGQWQRAAADATTTLPDGRRHTADTITDAALDALYRDRDRHAEEADALDAELSRIRRALDPDDETYIRETVDDQLEQQAAIARVRALHRNAEGSGICAECDIDTIGAAAWPCNTIRAIDGPSPTPHAAPQPTHGGNIGWTNPAGITEEPTPGV